MDVRQKDTDKDGLRASFYLLVHRGGFRGRRAEPFKTNLFLD